MSCLALVLVGCGGSARDLPGADDSSAPFPGDAASGDTEPATDGGACPSGADADLAANGNGPGQVAAVGGATGDALDCSLCAVGVNLVTSAGFEYPTIYIASAGGSAMTCASPSGASGVLLQGTLALDAAQPGVYQGAPSEFVSSNDCDQLVLSYDLPSDAGTLDCGDSGVFHGPPSCPTGCFSSCEDAGEAGLICSPCASGQAQPVIQYSLSNGCGATPGWGSWTVTLTSIVPTELPPDSGIGAGLQFYGVHGSLLATLLRGGSGPPVSVTLTF